MGSDKKTPFYVGLVVINNEFKVLLGKRREDDIWTGPGGGANEGETPEQAVVREAYEEAQLEVRAESLVPLQTKTLKNGKMLFTFLYLTSQDNTDVNLDPDSEVPYWDWYSPQDIPKDLTKDENRHECVMQGLMKIKGLSKALSFSELSGINVDTSDHAITEMANRSDDWGEHLKNSMAGYQLAEGSRKILLSPELELTCRQEDDGIYSGEVRNVNKSSGEYGEVLHKIIKKTLNDMVQELKLKEFISSKSSPTTVAQAEAIEAVVEQHEEDWQEREDDPMEAVADIAMVNDIKEILSSKLPNNEPLEATAENLAPVREDSPEAIDMLNSVLGAAGDQREIHVHIHLAKSKTVTRGGKQYYAEGPNQGKEVGTVRQPGQKDAPNSKSKNQNDPSEPQEGWKQYKIGMRYTISEMQPDGTVKTSEPREQAVTTYAQSSAQAKQMVLAKIDEAAKKKNAKVTFDRIKEAQTKKPPLTQEAIDSGVSMFEILKSKLSEIEALETLEKGKKAEIGEIRQWGKYKFQKKSDGWYYVDGPNQGKKMGETKAKKPAQAASSIDTTRVPPVTPAPKPTQEKPPKEESPATKVDISEEAKKKQTQSDLPYQLSEKAAPTRLLDSYLTRPGSEKAVRVSRISTGKPSKVPYKSPEGVDTNLVGTVSFGKSDKKTQEELNAVLADSEIILDSMGIRFIQPIDFTCQNVKNVKNTFATFQPIKGDFQENDRIDIKDRSSGLSKSLLHEIGHAIDYSLSPKDLSGVSFLSIAVSPNSPVHKDYRRLQELLKEAPFYQDRSDKGYLAKPTEIFARAFEVYSFSKAKKLHKRGKVSNNVLNGFNPDFLKDSKKNLGLPSKMTKQQLADSLRENGLVEEANKMQEFIDKTAKFNEELEQTKKKMDEMIAKEDGMMTDTNRTVLNSLMASARSIRGPFNNNVDTGNKYFKEAERKLVSKKLGFREDADKVEAEISQIMERILKNNELQKALQNIDFSNIPTRNHLPEITAILLQKSLKAGIIKSNA